MYEQTQNPFLQLAFLWPALAAASASEATGLIAKQFIDLAAGSESKQPAREPSWATPNTIALELKIVRLRDFSSAATGVPTLLCAPFTLHAASITDLAPGHSLAGCLRDAGLERLYVTDWRSADESMRFLAIDDYLAALNVLVDHLGGRIDLVGLCQGGWLALIYAARFPAKVRKLAIAGAPIDTAAAPSEMSQATQSTPMALFEELVQLGNGRIMGRKVQKLWGPETVSGEEIHRTLQAEARIGSPAFARLKARFEHWYAWTVNLPGTYYLESIEKLYKRNEIASGAFVALGERIDLSRLRAPLYLLAARDDELVAPAQLFAAERLVGTAPAHIHNAQAPCRHLGLFMGREILRDHWSKIAQWLREPDDSAGKL